MEFHNQEIVDILLALAESSGVSIIPDETVKGRASFYFSESTVEQALENFLLTYKLYSEKQNSVIRISKIKISYNSEKETASISAENVSLDSIFKALAGKIGKTILYDSLPSSTISVDIENLPISQILEICIRKFSDYSIESKSSYFYIKKENKNDNSKNIRREPVLTKKENLYSIHLEKARFFDVLKDFFELSQTEYSSFVQTDCQLENLFFSDKDFYTMLHLILEHGNADFVEKDGIFYIVDLQKKGISSKIKDTQIITLTWIQAQDIMSLIPSEVLSTTVIKINKNTNAVLLTGTQEEINPIKKFIEKIDVPMKNIKYRKYDIKYMDAKELISLIPNRIIQLQPTVIPKSNSILAQGSDELLEQLQKFIEDIDKKRAGVPVCLKYIQTETLMKKLPPSISKEFIIDSGYPNLLFYTGTEENLQLFMHELSMIDKPQPQIRYQLLVIQYSKGKSISIKPSVKVNKTEDNSSFTFEGSLSNVMELSFDIISKFGYQFAATLNSQIGNNTANVFTDTTLTALSGQEVKFQNTDTYRYIEYDYNVSSGTTTKTGVTQQITSGLIVNLNGWISGDNMITMSVNATVSKQNNEASSSATSLTLPSTSERVVNTQVRTKSGEPIVISGLIKEDTVKVESRIPILGSIPFLGRLFKHTSDSKEKSEIVIYIVPHLIQENKGINDNNLNIEHYYQTFIGNQK